jgi:phosphoglycerate dehydrogenase-like enzyme
VTGSDRVRLVVAVHDPPVWTIPAAEVRRIAAALPDVEVVDARLSDDRARTFPDAEVLVATRISDAEFKSARRLRWIHSTAVGVGTLMRAALVESPVVVTNSRGVHSEAIAEHAVALLLAVRRRLHVAAAAQARREWVQEALAAARTATLSETHLLVVGLGSIGARIAAMAARLGMRVTGMRRQVDLPPPPGVSTVVGPARLADVLGQADAIVLALPRTEETRALLGARELALMRPSAVLVNIARGRLIDETALVQALEQGRIAGAGLDAFEHEPLPSDHPLWRLSNVIITPHSAAFAGDYWPPAVDLFLDNMARFRRGDPLLNVVDKVRGY